MITPIGTWIAIKIIAEEIETESGLILSGEEVSKLHYKKAKVINVGNLVSVIKKNDIIYYHKGNSFTMLTMEGEPITWIQERDVLCIV